MKEYRHVVLSKKAIDHINDAARDGWRVIAYSGRNILGSSLMYDVIFERDLDSSKSTDITVEYIIVNTKGSIVEKINEYTLKGYKLVSFSNITAFGSTLLNHLVFERTVKIL